MNTRPTIEEAMVKQFGTHSKLIAWCFEFFGKEFLESLLVYGEVAECWYMGNIQSEAGLRGSQYCCGLGEMKVGREEHPRIKKALWRALRLNYACVYCSVNYGQAPEYDWLISIGFRVVQNWTLNPNSGNKIAILMFTFPYDQT